MKSGTDFGKLPLFEDGELIDDRGLIDGEGSFDDGGLLDNGRSTNDGESANGGGSTDDGRTVSVESINGECIDDRGTADKELSVSRKESYDAVAGLLHSLS